MPFRRLPLSKADVLHWDDAIVDGEARQLAAKPGAKPMDLPAAAAAEVARVVAAFRAARKAQSDRTDQFDASQESVGNLRLEVDELIGDLRDETDFTFRKTGSPPSIRRKAREYGVVYDTPRRAPDPIEPTGAPVVEDNGPTPTALPPEVV